MLNNAKLHTLMLDLLTQDKRTSSLLTLNE
ncbi:hypothetical protein V12B01_13135 [Vibrio splendidus 12B01]|nr:hypothetical protein V12B01_13135 [Vibrio splendidus 12B01]